jgi:hypothetical protein
MEFQNLFKSDWLTSQSINVKMKFLVPVALICLFAHLTFASPINCYSGNGYMGSILEEENTLGSDDILFSSLNKECQDADVCVYKCPCGKNVYFKDFTSYPNYSIASKLAAAFKQVCVRNIVEDENKSSWVNQYLLDISKRIKVSKESNRPTGLYASSPLNAILWKLTMSGEPSLMYFSKIASVLLTFEKMCTEDSNWKQQVKSKVDDYLDRQISDVSERFSGNSFLKRDFVGKLQDAWNLYNQMKQTNSAIYETMKQAKSDLKSAFVSKIKSSKDVMVCKCQDFFNVVGSSLPTSFSNTVTTSCNQVCSNSLEYVEEIDMDE